MVTEIMTPEEKQQITDAIREAEQATSAEIVTVIAGASDDYPYIPLLWAAMGALVFPMIALLVFPEWSGERVYAGQLLLFLLFGGIVQLPAVKMALIPGNVKARRAAAEARRHFMLQQLHTTQNRGSVMLFVSHAERYVEVLTDIGVAQKIPDTQWQEVVKTFIAHVKAKEVAQGYLEAIGQCRELLLPHFPPDPAEKDELPNHLIEV